MEVKDVVTGFVLFSSEKKTIKETVVEAVEKNVDLGGADLSGANLGGADLYRIQITEEQKEDIIHLLR